MLHGLMVVAQASMTQHACTVISLAITMYELYSSLSYVVSLTETCLLLVLPCRSRSICNIPGRRGHDRLNGNYSAKNRLNFDGCLEQQEFLATLAEVECPEKAKDVSFAGKQPQIDVKK